MAERASDDGWEDVGIVAVDSGHLWIGDPCYVLDPRGARPKELGTEWDELVPKMVSSDAVQWSFDAGTPGLGVSVVSGYGDGVYTVRVRRNPDGYVSSVLVEFI